MVALSLAKAGYFQGDPRRVLEAPADIVLMACDYEKFRSDYEKAFTDLNSSRE